VATGMARMELAPEVLFEAEAEADADTPALVADATADLAEDTTALPLAVVLAAEI